MLDNMAWDKISDVVREDEFYRFDHRLIFKTIAELIEKGHPADVVTVFESLQSQGRLDDVGGMAYLNALVTSVSSAAHIRRYAEIVHDRGLLRKLVSASDNIAESAFNTQGRETKTILDEAEQAILSVAEAGRNGGGTEFQELPIVLTAVVDQINDLYHRDQKDEVTGVSTGFYDLDRMTAGLQKGDLIIVAGRPSMGKTSFSMNIAEHVAINEGLPVAVFSMEMGAQQLGMRILGSVGKLNQTRLRTGQLNDEDWERLTVAIEKMHDTQLYIDETPALNPLDLRARARRLARTCGGLGLIVVDYLQLMSSARSGDNRAAEISEISRSLKALARELECPLIALSQLNRSVEQRPDKRPMMSDLRESGAIEQDADIIMFVYREEVYNKEDPSLKGKAEIGIGKQRNGPIGTVHLKFVGEFTKFDNADFADEYVPEY
ncbi:replicative DNA helicase [Formosimonas limnophila]|uniref:Replicative DNA helicase n=2 Tax=Formosimonas limnophila TaxID=1384487 RepID=A0A8J3FZM3_9BURK|nr:replicative DNA helicase [Formosimonas limnophila]